MMVNPGKACLFTSTSTVSALRLHTLIWNRYSLSTCGTRHRTGEAPRNSVCVCVCVVVC